nr:ATP-binding protein [uncultured Fluviicola sp.]
MSRDSQTVLDELLTDCISIARRVSHDLSPPMSEHLSLADLVCEVLAPWKQVMTIDFRCDVRHVPDLPNHVKIQFMRVVQEWVSNIVKHAKATTIQVHYRHSERGFSFSIRDNGKGFDTAAATAGLGLKNIEMRMHYLGGNYRLRSENEMGTSALFILSHSIKANHDRSN